jgi:SAM-dependent methyltransferase
MPPPAVTPQATSAGDTQRAACPVCAAGSGRPWLVKGGFPILRCDSCGSGFLPEHAVPEDLEDLYSKEYFHGGRATGYPSYLADAGLLERNFGKRIAWIESLHPPGRLLEIGAAYGLFLKQARARGWDAMGVEMAADCAAAAAQSAGVPVVAGDFLAASLPSGFDVIAMFDVIEHMRDPIACIERARSLLAPDGLLVIETGDLASPWARLLGARWYFLDPPQHLVYFSAASLEHAIRRCGFAGAVRVRRLGRWVSLANIEFKLTRQAPDARTANALAALARRRLPGAVYLNFRDGILVAARCR